MISQDCLHNALSYGKCFTGLGQPADYIPELARVNKHQLGVSIVKLDQEILNEGDYDRPFTIQSISKLVSLILALHDRGGEYLFQDKVGVEPTGDPFNSIIKLETKTRPFNPFINAGAITVASCIDGRDTEERFARFLTYIRHLCNNESLRNLRGGCGGLPGLLFQDVLCGCDCPGHSQSQCCAGQSRDQSLYRGNAH